MTNYLTYLFLLILLILFSYDSVFALPSEIGQESDESPALLGEDLAKTSQNPLGKMSALNIEYSRETDVGPGEAGTDSAFVLKPAYPLPGSYHTWLLRAVIPVVNQDERFPGQGSKSGLGDINLQGYWIPNPKGGVTWGIGPSFLLPTASSDRLGQDQWAFGPAMAVVAMPGKWLVGALLQNLWGVGSNHGGQDINLFSFQYFINYNLDNGWYLTSTPTMTANWKASSDDRWTIPVGGGVGKIVHFGKQPVDVKLQAYKNVEGPEGAGDWSYQVNFKLLFPR